MAPEIKIKLKKICQKFKLIIKINNIKKLKIKLYKIILILSKNNFNLQILKNNFKKHQNLMILKVNKRKKLKKNQIKDKRKVKKIINVIIKRRRKINMMF